MQRWVRDCAVGVVLASVVGGCGGSSEFDAGAPSAGQVPGVSVSGAVLRQDGGAASNVFVTLQNRETNAEVTVQTREDGTYSARIEPGVYDARLDDSDSVDSDETQDDDEANGVVGPLVLEGDTVRNFEIDVDDRLDPGRISGQIFTTGDQPAANRRLVFQSLSAVSHNPNVPAMAPADIETVTDEQGRFSISLGTSQAVGLNLYVYNADGTEDEFVDIFKPSGALYVQLAIDETEVENSFSVTGGVAPEQRIEVSQDMVEDETAATDSVLGRGGYIYLPGERKDFRVRVTSDGWFSTDARLEYGLVAPIDYNKTSRDFTRIYPFSRIQNLQDVRRYKSLYSLLTEPVSYALEEGKISRSGIGTPGFLVKNYQSNPIYSSFIELLSDAPASYRFFDIEGESYYLRVLAEGYHSLNYSSEGNPSINTVEISTGYF